MTGTNGGHYSSEPDDFTGLSHSNKPLPKVDVNSSSNGQRSVKIWLVILSGLLVSALAMALLGNTQKEVLESEVNVSLTGPASEDLEVTQGAAKNRVQEFPSCLKKIPPGVMEGRGLRSPRVSRGKAKGVSEKTNQLSYRRSRSPEFEWNEKQLAWQRTAFHFQPPQNWMNDPNGPLFYKGWYHIFYQYNPNAAVWGDIVWGHAVSRDLIKWLHLPAAMIADRWYDINGVWTGSATLLPDGQIIMLYSGSSNDSTQVQNLAYPADLSDPLLINWIKYPGNPILLPPPGIDPKDFRDPTTAWNTAGGKWRFAIGSKMNRTGISLVYETQDFKSFKLLDGVLHAVPATGMWECVDFYPVSMTEPNGMDTSVNGPHVKHVLKASLDEDRNDYYAIGRYDEEKGIWVPDNPENDVGIGLRYDYGKFYASKTFYDQEKRRRVLWGWITESDNEAADIRKGWASLQAIPRTVVYDQKTGTNLLQWPVEEVESLRTRSKNFINITVQAGSFLPLDVGSATELDIIAEFEIDLEALDKLSDFDEEYTCGTSSGANQRGALGPFGLLVLATDDFSEQTPVYFYITKGSDGNPRTFFCTDASRSSIADDVMDDISGSTVPVLRGEKFSLRILVDHSIIEAFAQGGRTGHHYGINRGMANKSGVKVMMDRNDLLHTLMMTGSST
ncbi:hypothetical protein Nepgr_011354 [Nepenthes gracilis]|uniref:beta-fructofuranosidase n=1 Tax=Nepenthes gracilis TaxID=150966 RepID=A0AAD3SE17_NEPGR|nr:hypothetical protein Nepgr_011354 [Nepenthes gracilis]